MVVAGLIVGTVFTAFSWVPATRNVAAFASSISWDATTYCNIAVLAVIALLMLRFLRTGGVSMLRMMNMPAEHTTHVHHSSGAPHEPVAGA
jgi:hypothetical protein